MPLHYLTVSCVHTSVMVLALLLYKYRVVFLIIVCEICVHYAYVSYYNT